MNVHEPGHLEALGDAGRAAWAERVASCFAGLEKSRFVQARPTAATPHATVIDWTGFPVRVAACLSRRRAQELLDWRGERGDEGRRRLQEEYLEWRVVRGAPREIRRVEFTTELPEYWRVLAAHEPSTLLETIAELAGKARVAARVAYGDLDPLARRVTPAQRESAFAAAMLEPGAMSGYNTGANAICCMVQRTNTLRALASLVAVAGAARRVRNAATGEWRCLTAAEAIPLFPGAAVQHRASDPLVAERVGRLAFEGRRIALEDPPGVYIQGVEHTRLRTPDGDAVPLEWFRFARGQDPRFQRLTFEVPPGEGLAVSDLVDVATGRPIRFGAQVAELVQVVLRLRVGPAGAVPFEPCETLKPAATGKGARNCTDVVRHDRAFAGAR